MNFNKNNFRHKVEKLYYNYGKFAASHPVFMLTGVIIVIIISCYPLSNTLLYRNSPFHQTKVSFNDLPELYKDDKKFIGYIQQIIVKSQVHCNKSIRDPIEAIYASLSECFTIVQIIRDNNNFVESCFETGDTEMDDINFKIFPTFSCLMLSPAQLWEGGVDKFWADGNILRTLNSQKYFIREIAFGLPWKKTGISNVFTETNQRNINYAITFLLKNFDKTLLSELMMSMKMKYNISIHEPADFGEEILYIDQQYLATHVPLMLTYLLLILYVYFSVRKIELVKSKWGLAFSALFTVAASLYMSLGICIYIGVIVPTLPGSEVFPYLVVIIGLENTLVVTKSVVSTPVDLPVKHRIAQGLEKEGWAISKNLISEIFLMSLGIFTFNPAIQEFFLLAVIGLSVDFFLQLTFFVTVLSIDMRRIELSDIKDFHQSHLMNRLNDGGNIDMHLGKFSRDSFFLHVFRWLKERILDLKTYCQQKMNIQSQKVNKGHKRKASDINMAAFIQSNGTVPVYIPRRLIFLYFWAKSRFFQKIVMIVAAVWILFIILYSTNSIDVALLKKLTSLPLEPDYETDLSNEWKLMAMNHWPRIAEIYSINITNRKLFILPTWTLQHHVIIPHQQSLRKDDFSKNHSHKWLSAQFLYGKNDIFQQLPNSLRGWADMSFTFKMIIAGIIGVGIVLMTTALLMTIFQAIQTVSGDNREPVLRILPLKIETNYSVPPGTHCFSSGPIIIASGLEINAGRVDFKIKSWSIETGQLLSDKIRKGVWDIVIMDNDWVVIGFDSGMVELWKKTNDDTNGTILREIDLVNIDKGGIVKLMYSIQEKVIIASTNHGWIITLSVKQERLVVGNTVQAFIHIVRDFCLTEKSQICICSSYGVKILQLPYLDILKTIDFPDDSVLAIHLIHGFLTVALKSQTIKLIDLSNDKIHQWKTLSPVHWVRCCASETNISKSVVITFDFKGAICLWRTSKRYPIRQILIEEPSVIYPGPITMTSTSLIFADQGYLRIFNVRLNKYERSIQILGFKSVNINEIQLASEKWLVCLNEQCDLIVLPISTIK